MDSEDSDAKLKRGYSQIQNITENQNECNFRPPLPKLRKLNSRKVLKTEIEDETAAQSDCVIIDLRDDIQLDAKNSTDALENNNSVSRGKTEFRDIQDVETLKSPILSREERNKLKSELYAKKKLLNIPIASKQIGLKIQSRIISILAERKIMKKNLEETKINLNNALLKLKESDSKLKKMEELNASLELKLQSVLKTEEKRINNERHLRDLVQEFKQTITKIEKTGAFEDKQISIVESNTTEEIIVEKERACEKLNEPKEAEKEENPNLLKDVLSAKVLLSKIDVEYQKNPPADSSEAIEISNQEENDFEGPTTSENYNENATSGNDFEREVNSENEFETTTSEHDIETATNSKNDIEPAKHSENDEKGKKEKKSKNDFETASASETNFEKAGISKDDFQTIISLDGIKVDEESISNKSEASEYSDDSDKSECSNSDSNSDFDSSSDSNSESESYSDSDSSSDSGDDSDLTVILRDEIITLSSDSESEDVNLSQPTKANVDDQDKEKSLETEHVDGNVQNKESNNEKSYNNRELKGPSQDLLEWRDTMLQNKRKNENGFPIRKGNEIKNWEKKIMINFLIKTKKIYSGKSITVWTLARNLKLLPEAMTTHKMLYTFSNLILPCIEDFQLNSKIVDEFIKYRNFGRKSKNYPVGDLSDWAQDITSHLQKDENGYPKNEDVAFQLWEKQIIIDFLIKFGISKALEISTWELACNLKIFPANRTKCILQCEFELNILPNIKSYHLPKEEENQFLALLNKNRFIKPSSDLLDWAQKETEKLPKDEYNFPICKGKIIQNWEKNLLIKFLIKADKIHLVSSISTWNLAWNLKIVSKQRSASGLRTLFLRTILLDIERYKLPKEVEEKFILLRNSKKNIQIPTEEMKNWAKEITKDKRKDKFGFPRANSKVIENWEQKLMVEFLIKWDKIKACKSIYTWSLAFRLKIFPKTRTENILLNHFTCMILPLIENFDINADIKAEFIKIRTSDTFINQKKR